MAERGAAAFFYEELTWPHVTFQFGARVNHAAAILSERWCAGGNPGRGDEAAAIVISLGERRDDLHAAFLHLGSALICWHFAADLFC